jgi:hypothetical protein
MGWVGSSTRRFTKNAATLKYSYQSTFHIEKLNERSEPKVPYVQSYYQFLVPLTLNMANRTWLLRKPALEEIFVKPAFIDRIFLKLSPVGMYDAATQAWAGTDLFGIQDFFSTAQNYRQTVIDYFYDKKAFASRQWFAADKGAVDWSTLPQFSFQRSDVGINAKRALSDLLLLLIANTVLFIITLLIFIRSEV